MVRYTSFVDLHLVLRDEQGWVLFGQRTNTGWADGQLGLPSGHLEENESATGGTVREAEEIGVVVKADNLQLAHVMHHHTTAGRMALFFESRDWSGEITNTEPDKCAGWSFIDPADPPVEIVPYIATALRHIESGHAYSEGGWS